MPTLLYVALYGVQILVNLAVIVLLVMDMRAR